MPLLRYRLGDTVTVSTEYCPCGKRLRVISDLEGRSVDFVVTNSDRVIYGSFFVGIFLPIKGIARYQVHQYKKGEIVIYLVKNKAFTEDEIQRLISNLGQIFRDDLAFEIEYVDEIIISPSGKRRSFISHISSQHLPSYYPVEQGEIECQTL